MPSNAVPSQAPRLVPVAPHTGRTAIIRATPFWIGAENDTSHALFLPGISSRHVAVTERADGYWLTPQRGVLPEPSVNGVVARAPQRLRDGDVIELLPQVAYRFETLVSRAPPPASTEPQATPPPEIPRKRRRRQWRWRDLQGRVVLAWAGALLALVLVVGAGLALMRALQPPKAESALTPADADAFDQLMRQATEHIERGTTLLELGLPQPALSEFGKAVVVLKTSPLVENRWVRPRIEAMESAIAGIYESKRIAIPTEYRDNRRGASTAVVPLLRNARMTTAEFTQRFSDVQQEFRMRFGVPLVVTGADHAEHLSLYGRGSALDLRTRDLTPAQVDFAIAELRRAGLRVKDFSRDAVLQQQIAAARRAGHPDRAGTGLHLHVDRFPDRRDRWTTQ